MPAELSLLWRTVCDVDGCGQNFSNKSAYDRHKTADHGFQQSETSKEEQDTDEGLGLPDVDSPLRCSHKNCEQLRFSTRHEFRYHKVMAPDHHYCWDCDQDAEDWEGWVKHKITSANHLACPICGAEFKGAELDEDGKPKGLKFLNKHITSRHGYGNNLVCFGCDKHFDFGVAIAGHLNMGVCPGVEAKAEANKDANAGTGKKTDAEIINEPKAEATKENTAETNKHFDFGTDIFSRLNNGVCSGAETKAETAERAEAETVNETKTEDTEKTKAETSKENKAGITNETTAEAAKINAQPVTRNLIYDASLKALSDSLTLMYPSKPGK